MAEQDFYVKRLLKDRSRFADLYNAEVFHGRQVLKAEDLTPIPNESGIVIMDQKGIKRTIQRRRDVIMKASFGIAFAVMAVESQAEVHYAMPVRSLTYDALDYTEQIQVMEKLHKESGDLLSTGAEFLSHITKKDRLIPIINLILYVGKNGWDGPESLYDMMGIDDTWDGFDEIKEYLPNYCIHIMDARNVDGLNRFQTGLQHVFGMLKYESDKQKLYDYAQEYREAISKLDEDTMTALVVLLGEQKRLLKILESSGEKEEADMCTAIDELIEDGRAEGKVEGKVEGNEEGENRMASLAALLLSANKTDILAAALNDKQLRSQLFEQYHL